MRVPWIARRLNQAIRKEINPEYLLEGLILKLKLQYFGHLMWRVDSLEKTLMLGNIEGRRKGQQRKRCLYVITDSVDMSLSKLWEIVKDRKPRLCCRPWLQQRVRHGLATEQVRDENWEKCRIKKSGEAQFHGNIWENVFSLEINSIYLFTYLLDCLLTYVHPPTLFEQHENLCCILLFLRGTE